MTNLAVDLGANFHVIKMLGKGAGGEVYLVNNQARGRVEAVKVLAPTAKDKNFAARFEREAKATNRLDHPNIVHVYEYGALPGGRPFIALEFVDGETLADLVARTGPQPSMDVTRMLSQLALAVAHAHERGVIHRDLKPQNLIVDARGTLKILDFGLAKIVAPDHVEEVELTTAGDIFGSPEYMAPEQFFGKPPDPRTDVYALGCIAFELLVGRPPFAGTLIELMQGHMNGPVVTPSSLQPNADIPSELDAVVLGCMAKAAEDRFSSGAELAEALRGVPCALNVVEGTGNGVGRARLREQQAAEPPSAEVIQHARVCAWNLANGLIACSRATSGIVSGVQQLQGLAQTSASHTSLRFAIDSLIRERATATMAERFDLDMQIATMQVRLQEIVATLGSDYEAAYKSLSDALDQAISPRIAKKLPEELNAYKASRHIL